MILLYTMCALLSQIPSWLIKDHEEICLPTSEDVNQWRNEVVDITIQTVAVSSITLLVAFRLLIQPSAIYVPDLWLEVKALNSIVATALTALYAIFTYPLALGVMVI